MTRINFILFFLFSINITLSQDTIDSLRDIIPLPGQVTRYMIDGDDTIYIADLEEVDISTPRVFANQDEHRMYLRYKKYANDVYPYAKEAIELYRTIQEETNDLKKGKKRKFVRRLNRENDYKQNYTEQFKNMTRTQGKVLIKMIERELDIPFFDLIKDVKGGFTATYWNSLSKLYGYHLKEKYEVGQDPLLDAVLRDFNITERMK